MLKVVLAGIIMLALFAFPAVGDGLSIVNSRGFPAHEGIVLDHQLMMNPVGSTKFIIPEWLLASKFTNNDDVSVVGGYTPACWWIPELCDPPEEPPPCPDWWPFPICPCHSTGECIAMPNGSSLEALGLGLVDPSTLWEPTVLRYSQLRSWVERRYDWRAVEPEWSTYSRMVSRAQGCGPSHRPLGRQTGYAPCAGAHTTMNCFRHGAQADSRNPAISSRPGLHPILASTALVCKEIRVY